MNIHEARNVFHDECQGLDVADEFYEIPNQSVRGVFRVSWATYGEPLAGRSPKYHVRGFPDYCAGHVFAFEMRKFAEDKRRVSVIETESGGCVRTRFNGEDNLEPRLAKAFGHSPCAGEEGNRRGFGEGCHQSLKFPTFLLYHKR